MIKQLKRLPSSRAFYSFVGLILLFVVSSFISPTFRTSDNLITILRQASTLMVLSSGLTAVLITGGMDLSVGQTAAFVGCSCAQLMKFGIPVPVVIIIGLLLGACVGTLNGFLVSNIGLPSFVATYSTNWLIRGLSIIIMQGAVVYGLPEGFTFFGTGYIGPIPVITIIAAIIIILCFTTLQKTTFGRNIYSIGSNIEAARYSAINVKKSTYSAFIMCSMMAAVGGLLITARLDAAEAAMGDAYGLQTVAAVVIGGTSMLGGEGGVIGTAIGAILLTAIVNIMNLLGTSSQAQPMVVGIVIILMVMIDSLSRTKKVKVAKTPKKEAEA